MSLMFQCGPKVQRIVDIWEEEQGVISLHVFQNVIPAEAYTREACIIEAVGETAHSVFIIYSILAAIQTLT